MRPIISRKKNAIQINESRFSFLINPNQSFSKLSCRDSNPKCLDQNQMCYRLHHKTKIFKLIQKKIPQNLMDQFKSVYIATHTSLFVRPGRDSNPASKCKQLTSAMMITVYCFGVPCHFCGSSWLTFWFCGC